MWCFQQEKRFMTHLFLFVFSLKSSKWLLQQHVSPTENTTSRWTESMFQHSEYLCDCCKIKAIIAPLLSSMWRANTVESSYLNFISTEVHCLVIKCTSFLYMILDIVAPLKNTAWNQK